MIKNLLLLIKRPTTYEQGQQWVKNNLDSINPIQVRAQLGFIKCRAPWGKYEQGIIDALDQYFPNEGPANDA